jgi:protocatechuate 3,4-dioxygenase alpha subunit
MALTPWHTIGPFFPGGFFREGDNDLSRATPAHPQAAGVPIVLRGHVRQEGGVAAVNAVLEAWQADRHGLFRHPADPGWRQADPHFFGWGRSWTDAAGGYEFRSVMPGGYDEPAGRRAPHINLAITASGIMRRLLTTVFFPGETDNEADPVLGCVPDAAGRARLVARADGIGADGARLFAFDIVLRGEGETPFFAE